MKLVIFELMGRINHLLIKCYEWYSDVLFSTLNTRAYFWVLQWGVWIGTSALLPLSPYMHYRALLLKQFWFIHLHKTWNRSTLITDPGGANLEKLFSVRQPSAHGILLPDFFLTRSNLLWQVIIFVKSVQRCSALAQLLVEQNFPAISIHRGMEQEERWGNVMVSFITLPANGYLVKYSLCCGTGNISSNRASQNH